MRDERPVNAFILGLIGGVLTLISGPVVAIEASSYYYNPVGVIFGFVGCFVLVPMM